MTALEGFFGTSTKGFFDKRSRRYPFQPRRFVYCSPHLDFDLHLAMSNRELSPKELEWLQGLVLAKGYQIWWLGAELRLREVYLIDHARVRLLRYDGDQQLKEMAKGYYRQYQAQHAQVLGLTKLFSWYRLTLVLLGQHIIQS